MEGEENLYATTPFARPRQIDAHAVEGDYFAIKKYDLSSGRFFTQQEAELGTPVVVIGDEVAKYFFPGLTPIGRALPTAISPAAPASHGALNLRPRGRTVSLPLNDFGPSPLHDTSE